MDWDKLRIFHAVADAGSLTHAGDTLLLSQSAVSRQIRALEESLGVTLFHRHARGLILTEQGELLFEATKSMRKRLESATARIRDSSDTIYGELRVTTTTGFGTMWLAPRLKRLYERYPNLKIDLILEERVLDLPMREADVAVRMKEPSQADLIRRRLMDVVIKFYASRNYIEAFGEPRTVEDLATHRIISQSPTSRQVSAGQTWMAPFLSAEHASHLTVNNYFGILQAVVNDLGIGSLPNYLITDFPQLVNVLPEEMSKAIPVYIAYPVELRQSKRVAAFRDFLIEEITLFKRQNETLLAIPEEALSRFS
ncbi:LysR family transcriptional regulator [Halovulum dunhuangense]|uniref:LysR family transcriptional regulator n=1 Tax=Halovulum dunhuangense TaxID=1505036 RepID=A0A849L6Q7_9RHOB|nr:LysR family transcriptional regulator [Halovulum dunhuangense]NNU81933.1 LysR family transcriptional regulator [Halovulum dunhuangense]